MPPNRKKDWALLLFLFITLRVAYSILGFIVASGPKPEPLAQGVVYDATQSLLHSDRFSELFLNVWMRWDTGWYLKIAAFGYSPGDGSTTFQPLYPFLVSLITHMTGNYMLSALLLSNLACLAAFLLLYEVAMVEGLNQEKAVWAVVFFALFPTAFFLFSGYTDSLFLALLLGTWLALRQQKWVAAGILGGLATLCRLQGVVLVPVLTWAWLASLGPTAVSASTQWSKVKAILSLFRNRSGIQKIWLALRKPAWLGTFIPGLAFCGWTLALRVTGNPSIPTALAKHWGIRTVAPWTGVWLFIERLFTRPRVFIDYIDLAALIIILILLVARLRRFDPALFLYAGLTLAVFFMRGTPPHLMDSMNRYLLSIFPVFFILGTISSRWLRISLMVVSSCLQVFLLLGFLDWRWVA